MSDKSNADVLSWALSMSTTKDKIKNNKNDEENRSPNLENMSRRNADILDYALTLSLSSKKQKLNRNDDNMTNTYEHNNNDMTAYDNDVNNDEYNNDDIDMNTNTDNLELDNNDNTHNQSPIKLDKDNNDNTHNQSPIKLDKAKMHSLLLDKAAKVLEFELIDILNNGSLEQLLELKGIGKKFAQNILG